MEAWRSEATARRRDIFLLQETHVTTALQAGALNNEWNAMWGIADTRRTTFWGLAGSKAAGVGILINPMTITNAAASREDKWSERHVAIEVDKLTITNVYTPNDEREREQFFTGITKLYSGSADRPIIGGDYNCVQNRMRDRLRSSGGSARSESPQLVELQAPQPA